MDFDVLLRDLSLSPSAMARKLGVSTGHVADLKSGRRKLSLELAAKLEAERPGTIAAVVQERTGRAA